MGNQSEYQRNIWLGMNGGRVTINVEIKVKVRDPDGIRRRIESLSDTACEVISQEDVYFPVAKGRLKSYVTDGLGDLFRQSLPEFIGGLLIILAVSAATFFRSVPIPDDCPDRAGG